MTHFSGVLLSVTLCAIATVVIASESLTEGRAIELGLARTDVRNWLDGQRAAVAAETRRAGRWHNPQIEYNREDLDLPAGTSRESFYWLRQRFNVSGQLGLERDAAQKQQLADEADIELARRSLIAEIRETFYSSLHALRRAGILRRNAERLAGLHNTLVQRARAGDASRYDSLRLQREAALLRGHAATAQAQADAALEQLAGLIGVDADSGTTPAGGLLPPPLASEAEHEAKLLQHPGLKSLTMAGEAQRLTAKAASREGWPELTLGVGQRELSEPGLAGDGDMIAIGIEIPLFERGTQKRNQANARMHALQAEQRLLYQRLLSELHGKVKLLHARRQAAEDLIQLAGNDSDSLTAIAEQAYWAGEMPVMELLDAYRSARDAQLESLDLQLAARIAYIDIQTLTEER